jgi:hypothetical protein
MDRSIQKVVGKFEQAKSGLLLPPDMIRGRHFGGFHKLDPWIKDVIRASCRVVRGIGPDELSELVTWVEWGEKECRVTLLKFNDLIHSLDTTEGANGQSFSDRFKGDIRRTDSSRAYGSILVVAIKPDEVKEFHKGHDDQRGFPGYVGAWVPGSVEEAETVQPPTYLGG